MKFPATTKKEAVYLDYAATTPLDRAVWKKMIPYFLKDFGNPAALYNAGRKTRRAIDNARSTIAAAFGCDPREFFFTASATESDNLALFGIARANKDKGGKIIVSALEHKGVVSACDALRKEGFEVSEVLPDSKGRIDPQKINSLLDEKTILVSIGYADSETGTTQPINKIADVIKRFRKKHKSGVPYFHTDAAQAALYLDINVEKIGVDLLTISSHKMYGPIGIAGLYVRRGVTIAPLIYGGGQQGKLRSGTENVPAIVGFGEAVRIAARDRKKEAVRLEKLRNMLQKKICAKIDKVVLNGDTRWRLPNFLNISILDIEGEALLLYMDRIGIYAGTGSACNSETLEPSRVLCAFGNPYEYIHGSLRFTLGKQTSASDIKYVVRHLPAIVKELRKISPLNLKVGQKEQMSYPKAFIGNQTPRFLRKKSYDKKKQA